MISDLDFVDSHPARLHLVSTDPGDGHFKAQLAALVWLFDFGFDVAAIV